MYSRYTDQNDVHSHHNFTVVFWGGGSFPPLISFLLVVPVRAFHRRADRDRGGKVALQGENADSSKRAGPPWGTDWYDDHEQGEVAVPTAVKDPSIPHYNTKTPLSHRTRNPKAGGKCHCCWGCERIAHGRRGGADGDQGVCARITTFCMHACHATASLPAETERVPPSCFVCLC